MWTPFIYRGISPATSIIIFIIDHGQLDTQALCHASPVLKEWSSPSPAQHTTWSLSTRSATIWPHMKIQSHSNKRHNEDLPLPSHSERHNEDLLQFCMRTPVIILNGSCSAFCHVKDSSPSPDTRSALASPRQNDEGPNHEMNRHRTWRTDVLITASKHSEINPHPKSL